MSDRKRNYSENIKRRKLDSTMEEYSHFLKDQNESLLMETSSNDNSSAQNFQFYDSDNSSSSSSLSECESVSSDINNVTDSNLKLLFESQDPEIKELQAWVVSTGTPHKHMDALLKILRKRLLPNLPKSTRTFLKCNIKNYDIIPMAVNNNSMGEFVYIGLENQLKVQVKEEFQDSNVLELIVNIDGMSPFKSSSVSIWPILCKVYTRLDVYKPFTVAVFSGHGKPKDPAKYLTQFVLEINHLQKNGLKIESKKFDVKIKYFTCDCPARSFLKCVVGHCAFKGCERCRVVGHKVDGTTVFLQTDAAKKTNKSFRLYEEDKYHTDSSLLCAIEPPIKGTNHF